MVFVCRIFFFLWIAIMGLTYQANAETIAERLGYPADSVLLILHADDMGMCHSANLACIDVLEKGIVKSASVMVPCPWFLEVADYFKKNPDADLGIHLTLTSEWKHYRWPTLAPRDEVPGLLDPSGYMHGDVRQVYAYSNAQEAEKEVRAQIDFALKHGLKPTHLDSHMGTLYYHPEFLKMIFRVSEEYDIPFMMFKPTPQILERISQIEGFPLELVNQMMERGIPLLDGLPEAEDVPVDQLEDAYQKLIANLPAGAYEVILHPNLLTDESRAITGTHKKRAEEHRIFTDPSMKQFIEDQGVILIGWKDLYPLWKVRQR